MDTSKGHHPRINHDIDTFLDAVINYKNLRRDAMIAYSNLRQAISDVTFDLGITDTKYSYW